MREGEEGDLKSLAPLGQGSGLQVLNLLLGPTQELGRGLVQTLSEVCTPPPQVLVRGTLIKKSFMARENIVIFIQNGLS